MHVARLAAAAHDLRFPRLLVNELENVRRSDENSDCASNGHGDENKQLQAVYHHRDVSPVVDYLYSNITTLHSVHCVQESECNVPLDTL